MNGGSAAAMLVIEPRGGRAVPPLARLGERRLGSKRGGRVSEVAMRGKVYVAGPIAGAVIAIAFVLRGSGGGKAGSGAAQGDLSFEVDEPIKA